MTDMIHQPRTVDQATLLLERFAALSAELASVEANRNQAIAATNAVADTLATPIIAARDAIAAKLEPWWVKAAGGLTDGKRKSIELGGCMIGTRAVRATLTLAGDETAAIEALKAVRWGKPFLRTKVTIDRVAVLKALDGKDGGKLVELGFASDNPVPRFFVEPVAQGGTLAG